MASSFDWTTEATAQLRRFWTEGRTTAEIGRRLGIGKNAVIGKARRLGLPSRPSPIRAKGTGKAPRKQALPPIHGPVLPPPRPAADSTPPRLPPPASPVRPAAVPVRPAALPKPAVPAQPAVPAAVRPVGRDPCCWPIGEPGTRGFRSCDVPAKPGKPYCAEHAAVAYVPANTVLKRGWPRPT